MNCEHIRTLLEAYHDREVDAERAAVVEKHLLVCPECAAELRRLAALSSVLSDGELRYRAPDRLHRSLAAIPERRSPRSFLGGALAGFALAACLFFMLFIPRGRSMEDALIDDHVRAGLANHLFDVVSTDRHTVKPWFEGKLDFSPPVPDLKAEGFPLLGGRLEYVDGHSAASLVYGLRKHVINLYVIRGAQSGPPVSSSRGFTLIHWNTADLAFWAVSDVSESDLQSFAAAYRRAAVP